MSDNYEFTKSSIPQAIDDYSPYIDKQSNNYINDINGGVYTNNSLSLVTFDLGQIYNSNTFTDTNDLTLIIPVTMVAALANAKLFPITVKSALFFSILSACKVMAGPIPAGSPIVKPTLIFEDFNVGLFFKLI